MNTKTKYAFLLASITPLLNAADHQQKQSQKTQYMSMHEYFDRMFDDMQQSMQHMREAFSHGMMVDSASSGVDLNLEEKEKSVLITAQGIETEHIDATVNDENNNLLVKTDEGFINLNTDENYIGIQWQQKKEQETTTKDGKKEKIATSFAQQSYTMRLHQPLDLTTDTLKVDYDKENKTLSVEIPFVAVSEKARKTVPVHFKNSPALTKE